MESLMFNEWAQWLVDGISALICFWAWEKMFFWIKQKDLKAIVRILGAVLLFTPAPIAVDSTHYAPAFIVMIFRKFLENLLSPEGHFHPHATAFAAAHLLRGPEGMPLSSDGRKLECT